MRAILKRFFKGTIQEVANLFTCGLHVKKIIVLSGSNSVNQENKKIKKVNGKNNQVCRQILNSFIERQAETQ